MLGEDINYCDKSKSLYPAVTNIICFELDKYYITLHEGNKSLPEYVLSKDFKSFRIETVLQDYLLLNEKDSKNISVNMPRWLCFNPVKETSNNSEFYTPDSGENNLYIRNCMKLCKLGWKIGENCIIHIDPLISNTTSRIIDHLKGNIIIESNSKLVIKGNIYIKNLYLKGCLTIKVKSGGCVTINNLNIHNNGFERINERNGIFKTKLVSISEYVLEYGNGNYFINR